VLEIWNAFSSILARGFYVSRSEGCKVPGITGRKRCEFSSAVGSPQGANAHPQRGLGMTPGQGAEHSFPSASGWVGEGEATYFREGSSEAR